MFLIMIGIVLILVYLYIYFFLKRIMRLYVRTFSTKHHFLLLFGSFVIVLFAIRIFSLYTLSLLHFVVISLCVDGVYRLLHCQQEVWDKIYRFGLIPFICVALLLGYGSYHIKQLHQTYYTISTEKHLSRSYRIAYLSDLHYPNAMDEERLNSYCQRITAEKPDLIILGGDIVDEQTTKQQMQTAFQILGHMPCSEGVYYVYGNHDQGIYSLSPHFTSEELLQAIDHAGDSCFIRFCLFCE